MTGKPKDLITYLLEQDKNKLFDLTEHKEKRSQNANAYMWALVGQIGDALRMSKEEVYFNMLRDYGQSEVVSILSQVKIDGYFKYYEVMGESEIKGKSFTHYKIFKGSSEYNTNEMSILLDGVVEEAKQLGIETLTENQLNSLKQLWR